VVPDRLRPVLETVSPLAADFTAAGKRIYLVGGTVRDAIAGRPGGEVTLEPDIDLTTDAEPEEVERLLVPHATALWDQGRRFGTIGALVAGRRLEITTHRAEVYDPASRKPSVRFGQEIRGDLARRDFTINAMALSLPDLEMVDPFGGLVDLAEHRLRTPLEPGVSFADDPLRMMRAARFVAGYGLKPEPALVAAIRQLHDRLSIVSAERIRDELDKLVTLPKPSSGLLFLVESTLAGEFLPEVPALALEQDPVHRHKDVLAHTLAVVDRTSTDKVVRLAALLHDIGKPKTRVIGPKGVSFYHHDVVGSRMARERLKALRYPLDEVEAVARLIELHLRFHTYKMGWTDAAIRRYAKDAGPLLDRLNELTRADCTTRNPARARALARAMDQFEERLAELRRNEELAALRPELDGTEVMAALGLSPSREVGRALDFLMSIRLDEGLIGKAAALERLKQWWAAQGRRSS
jgi:poly(A) polymerase